MPRTLSNEAQGASSLDDLISNASKQADDNAARAKSATPRPNETQATAAPQEDTAEAKAAKKEKDGKDKANKSTRLVYSDNEISPEEKMSRLAKYVFTPTHKTVQV